MSGSDLFNPDFAALARAYGWEGSRVEETSAFEPALVAALARDGSTLIEVMLDPEVITTRAPLSAITRSALARR